MNIDVSAVGTVVGLIALASVIESWAPLREQAGVDATRLRINLTLITINLLIGVILSAILVLGAAWLGSRDWGLFNAMDIDAGLAVVLTVVLLDATAYAAHVLLHKVPWLWRIHVLHHSDETVDATTAYRHHPVEPLFRWSLTAVAAWMLGAPPEGLALYRSLSALNAILEHANIRVPKWLDRSLVWLWVTPDMHKIHHSRVRVQTDSNYSNLFSFFDRGFGTFASSSTAAHVSYGLDSDAANNKAGLWSLLKVPFRPRGSSAQSGSI
jgi:sterol desaturase/sphingolipid hydroxylase (fatty acid hydroxylase superfamily)